MSIAFSCNFCARKYRVEDALAGKKVKCKDCDTELTIPKPAAAAAAFGAVKPPPPQDLYGLDDGDEAPALPPPRRAGFTPDTPKRKRSNAAPDNAYQLRKSGVSLLIFGVGAIALPFLGVQWRLLHLFPGEVQLGLALLMILGGIFCLMASSIGVGKALLFSVLGGVVGVPALLFLLVLILNAAGVKAPEQNQPPQQAAAHFPKPPQQFAPPAVEPPPGFQPPAKVNSEARLGHVKITGGKAMAGRGPGGMPGVAFEIDYQIENKGLGVFNYDLLIKSAKGTTKIIPPVRLRNSGTHKVVVTSLQESDGPFEASFQASSMGKTGTVSDSVALAWSDEPSGLEAPPADTPPGFGPKRGMKAPSIPRPPRTSRFGPR